MQIKSLLRPSVGGMPENLDKQDRKENCVYEPSSHLHAVGIFQKAIDRSLNS
jgi:hypothetical protein